MNRLSEMICLTHGWSGYPTGLSRGSQAILCHEERPRLLFVWATVGFPAVVGYPQIGHQVSVSCHNVCYEFRCVYRRGVGNWLGKCISRKYIFCRKYILINPTWR